MKMSILVLATMSVFGVMFVTSCGPSANDPAWASVTSDQRVSAAGAATQNHQPAFAGHINWRILMRFFVISTLRREGDGHLFGKAK